MYAPRHRRFTTGLVHGEVKHFAQDKQSKIARAPKCKFQDVRMRSKK